MAMCDMRWQTLGDFIFPFFNHPDEILSHFLHKLLLFNEEIQVTNNWLTYCRRNVHTFWFKFNWNSFEYWQQTIISSDNALVPGSQQAIIWTNAGLFYWRIHESLRPDELRKLLIYIYIYIYILIQIKPKIEALERPVKLSHTGMCIELWQLFDALICLQFTWYFWQYREDVTSKIWISCRTG